MFCMNCGTKLPDGARFCFSCGAKIPVAGETQIVPNSQADSKIGGKVETKTNTPVETIEEPIKFVIHGKEFSVDGSYRNYIAERNRFYKAYYSYTDKIISEQFGTYKEYIDSEPDKCMEILSNLGSTVINWGLDRGINFLIEHGIFDVSKTVLSDECAAEQLQGFYRVYSKFEEGYLSIVATEEQMEEYRKLKHESRGRWQGGGFGVAGAVKGAAVAGALNMGGTILSSIGTAITGAIDSSMTRKEKREFLNKRNWFGDCFGGLLSDISLIFEKTYYLFSIKSGCKMPPVDPKKADIYFENIQQATTQQQVISITLMVLKEYPYHRRAYAKLITNLPFLDMGAIQLIEYFQPEGFWRALYSTYTTQIQKEYNCLPEDNYKQLDEKIAYFQDKIDVIIRERKQSAFVEGFATRYLENWQKLCEKLKIQRRTAEDGTVFDSNEKLDVFVAEKASYEAYQQQLSTVMSPEQRIIILQSALNEGFTTQKFFEEIKEKLEDVTCQLRNIESTSFLEKKLDDTKGEAVNEIISLAESGDANAQYVLAGLYQEGKYLDKNLKAAFEKYLKSAEQNHIAAQAHLGCCYLFGMGVTKDEKKAYAYFVDAAHAGNAFAQTWLSQMLYDSGYVSTTFINQYRNEDQALEWLQLASEQNDALALCFLGDLYSNGKIVKRDFSKAIKYYEEAAEQGNPVACNNLAFFYQNGQGVERSIEKALELLLKAVELKNDVVYILNLAVTYRDLGDYENARKWFLSAAEQGDAIAQGNLGRLYRDGLGGPQDYTLAVKWYTLAAEQGDDYAQTALGMMYEDGQGVSRDYVKAFEWYQKAAQQNYAPAQNNLGLLYEEGKGVSADHKMAMALMKAAAQKGNDAARKNYNKYKRLFDLPLI